MDGYEVKQLIYVAQVGISNPRADGVFKKILGQYRVFSEYFDTYILGYAGEDICVFHNGDITIVPDKQPRRHRRYKLYESASLFGKAQRAEYYYIRYGYSDYPFIKMLNELKTGCKTKIVVEIPTYPYGVQMNDDIKMKFLKITDILTRRKLANYVDRIATFSNDREIFNIPCLNIRNGIAIDDISIRQHHSLGNSVSLIAVASMERWHGYDRLIEGLHQYNEKGYTRKVRFHMVGDGPELGKYKTLAGKYKLEKDVTFHGFSSGTELDEIYNQCDIAVASLGMHRIGIKLASTIKTREYSAKGLPVITSCKIDMFPENYQYVLNVPGDESPIDISKIVEFYDRLYSNSDSFSGINNEIRTFARKNCDMPIVMGPIIDFFRA